MLLHSKNRTILRSTSIATLALLMGCGDLPQVSVKKNWAKTITNYGLIPIYPMRENVYVGGLRVTGTADDPFSLGYRNFGRADVSATLSAEIKAMPELPETTKVTTKDGKVTFPQTAEYDITKPRGKSNRMNLVALPSITIGRVSGADLAAKAPVGAAGAAFDAGFKASDNVHLALDGIESIELSDASAYEALKSACPNSPDVTTKTALQASMAQLPKKAKKAKKDKKEAQSQLSIVTRVFYARSITYSADRSRSFGSGVIAKQGKDLPNNVPTPTITYAADGTPNPVPAGSHTQQLDQNAPGVAASFIYASTSGLSLTQVFDRPMAFGADVMSIELKTDENGKVTCGEFVPPTNGPRALGAGGQVVIDGGTVAFE